MNKKKTFINLVDGDKIKKMRMDRNLSFEDLSKISGISKRTLGYCESNEVNMSLERIIALAIVFNCEIENLLVKNYKEKTYKIYCKYLLTEV